nr:HbmRII [Burkholderia pseudomallei]
MSPGSEARARRRRGADALALRSRATCAWLWRGRTHPQARARSIRALEPAFGGAGAALGRRAARFAACIDDRRQNRGKHGRGAGQARVKDGEGAAKA